MQKRILLWMLLLLSSATAFSDIRDDFGDDWTAAEQFVREHHGEWEKTFDMFGIDSRLAEAVVFPELVRYSIWQDKMETAVNTALYIRGGHEKANFSIGRFQMRPSFAENVEREWNASPLATEYAFSFITFNNADARRSRINRMTTTEGQVRYLAIYLRLQYLRHPWLRKKSRRQQVRYLATAYNSLYTYTSSQVRQKMKERNYHTDMIRTRFTSMYCYADVAWHFYAREYAHKP